MQAGTALRYRVSLAWGRAGLRTNRLRTAYSVDGDQPTLRHELSGGRKEFSDHIDGGA